jgi:DNA-directed RNA polymerase subunit beta'
MAGEKQAYDQGFTLGVDDLPDFGGKRDAFVTQAKAFAKKNQNNPEALARQAGIYNKAQDKAIAMRLQGKNNPLYDMVESGARGGGSQLRSILTTPLFVEDSKGRTIPNAISKSYSEGLDISDYWTSLYGARRGIMDRALQTAIPGGFSKEIMATVIDSVISKDDCGTTDGVFLDVKSDDVVGRYLAGNQLGFSHNALVDSSLQSKLAKKNIKTVKVRSPLKCEEPKGVCQKCYGIDENGNDPIIGENIGAKAGQTISEPLVQMAMNTFHSGGVAGDSGKAEGYARINQLLKLPEVVPGNATLATVSGRVTKISKGLAGGQDIFIGAVKHFVPAGRKLKVKVGSNVEEGDPLSTGVIKPQDLVERKGMGAAQEYLVDELQGAYKGQRVPIERKIFETVVRSTTNQTQVLNNPIHSPFKPGDVIPYTTALNHNKNLEGAIPVEQAVGLKLAASYGPMGKGMMVTEKDVKLLKALGHKTVRVKRDPVVHQPILKTINRLPMMKQDWMGALGFQRQTEVLQTGASEGWSTDLSGYHPIPALAFGKTFGKGEDGKY